MECPKSKGREVSGAIEQAGPEAAFGIAAGTGVWTLLLK